MKHLLLAGALIAASFTSSAQAAAIVVYGRGPAADCYSAAAGDRRDRGSIALCDLALNHDFLTRQDRSATFINRGVLYLRRGSDAQALDDFESAIALTPNFGEAHLMRGVALVQLGRHDEAIETLTRALTMNLEGPERAYFYRGTAYEDAGNARAAYRDYQRAAELAPDWRSPSQELTRFQVQR